MKVAIRCNKNQEQEIAEKNTSSHVDFIFISESIDDFANTEANVFFDLLFDENAPIFFNKTELIFVNAITTTCKLLPPNYVRINAWNGFLKREIIELVALENNKKNVEEIMNYLGWKYQLLTDEVGMISPKIIAMIVNEAYFGLEDNISTKAEIDIAMKLGTNYPYGPFEWSERIGLQNIYQLLKKLSQQDTRYNPSKLLEQTATHL